MDVLLAGLQAGAQYAILAGALVIVFKTTGVFNFATGTFATVGVYVTLEISNLPIPGAGAVILGCVAVGVLSILIELGVARPMQRRLPASGAHVVVVLLLLLMVLGEGTVRLIYSAQPRSIPAKLAVDGVTTVAGVPISHVTILTLGSLVAASLASLFLLQRTRVGIMARAVAADARAAQVAGVRANGFRIAAWCLSGMLAAYAGWLLSNSVSVAPSMAQLPMVKAIAGVALGGLSNLPGAIVCSVLIGVLEAVAVVHIGGWATSILPLVVIFVMLLVRPDGLFGTREAVRV
ncbi:branched-chain amino acid ABC transporter permease [Streptomyces sp. NPDC059582]|uniref:branched-chain amino acid ABC transporter permease n=1 Tax=Streptomyces sp. NPDC059582 TaxID=3346875 RepID=UPI0036878839